MPDHLKVHTVLLGYLNVQTTGNWPTVYVVGKGSSKSLVQYSTTFVLSLKVKTYQDSMALITSICTQQESTY